MGTLPIRAVVFDIGGVVFPWPSPDYFAQWEGQLDIAPDRLHRILWYGPDIEAANVGAITAEEYCRRCGERLNRADTHVRALIEGAFSGESLNDELAAYARTLRSRVRVAALTNTWSFGRALIQRRGIAGLFDLIVTSAEEGVTKPDARLYRIVLERLALTPAEALFVDDSEENVAATRAIGIRSVWFRSTEQAIAELEALLANSGAERA